MTPHHSTGWHSPAGRHLEKDDLRALVDNKMNKVEQAASLCTDCIQSCVGKCIAHRLREAIFSPLFVTCETTSGMLCLALGSSVQEKYQNNPYLNGRPPRCLEGGTI